MDFDELLAVIAGLVAAYVMFFAIVLGLVWLHT